MTTSRGWVQRTATDAPRFAQLPAVFGHEGAGIVEATGPRVGKFKPGDRVALTFGSCGECRNCHLGAPHNCALSSELNFMGQRADGSTTLADSAGAVRGAFFQQSSFASLALVTERNAVKLPEDFPLELAGPLGCGIQTGEGRAEHPEDRSGPVPLACPRSWPAR